jgi:flagellar basal body-associated protein FliL
MRRFSLAFVGLGLCVLVSIAVADGDLVPVPADHVPSAPTATDSTPAGSDAIPREQVERLVQELQQKHEADLKKSQRELQELEAAKLLSEAMRLLSRVSDDYPETAPAQDAAFVLRHLTARGLQRQAGPATVSGLGSGAPRLFADAQQRAFIDFGQVVVNLDEGQLNRYLQVQIALQVQDEQIAQVSARVASNKAALMDWLLGHLSDQSLEDIRGSESQNRLRNEIKDGFNTVLFPGSEGQIQLVLFEKFVVQ